MVGERIVERIVRRQVWRRASIIAVVVLWGAGCEGLLEVNDPTVEKLGEILNQNPNGVTLCRDELYAFLRSLDKLAKGITQR